MTYYPYTKETAEKFGIRITSDYGWRFDPITGARKHHNGIDLAPIRHINEDIELIATIDGVIENSTDGNGGLYTYIRGDNGEGELQVHHRKFLKPNKSKVRVGDVIALMGKSGRATGVHVDYERRKNHKYSGTHYDPKPFIYYISDMQITDPAIVQGDREWYETIKSKYNVDLLYGMNRTELEEANLLRALHEYVIYLSKTDADDPEQLPTIDKSLEGKLSLLEKRFDGFVGEISDSIKDKEKAIKDEKDAVEKAKA